MVLRWLLCGFLSAHFLIAALAAEDIVPPAPGDACQANLLPANPPGLPEDKLRMVQSVLNNPLDTDPALPELRAILETYLEVRAHFGAELDQWFNTSEVLELVGDPTRRLTSRRLKEVLVEVRNLPEGSLTDRIRSVLERKLLLWVSGASRASRIQSFLAHEPGSLFGALGKLELKEIQTFFYGGQTDSVSPESLVGQYLQESGATPLWTSFASTPGGNRDGPRRLVIPVDGRTFPIFEKYFKRPEWTSVFAHAFMVHNGEVHSYNSRQPGAFRNMSPGNILPVVLLQSTEADRLDQFYRLLDKYNVHGWHNTSNLAMVPWGLPNYCAEGGYSCCTQWIGNIPLGDVLVDQYMFPGRQEVANVQDRAPRIQPLRPYEHADPMIKRVWKVPGYQALPEMLGDTDAKIAGNYTNSGWIIHTLLGITSAHRVPMVFLFVQDARQPLAENFRFQFEGLY